ncbi:hypothetical protein [Lunatibacter salilacus]|nr:hypothetical protein [Lunatibacter salilacus]
MTTSTWVDLIIPTGIRIQEGGGTKSGNFTTELRGSIESTILLPG